MKEQVCDHCGEPASALISVMVCHGCAQVPAVVRSEPPFSFNSAGVFHGLGNVALSNKEIADRLNALMYRVRELERGGR